MSTSLKAPGIRTFIERMQQMQAELKRLENQTDEVRVLYLHAPRSLRSPLLREELRGLVERYARLQCELNNLIAQKVPSL